MDPDKAPGPDGFTAKFLQACWLIIEKDLLRMVQKSQNTQKIGGSTNSAFLALIPKEKGANTFSRFRPISLCNIGYKIITRIIANRLKPILPKIIPENQGGFIQGRQIVDNYLLVQEAIHSSLRRKEKGMAIKLDLANAFDRLNHSFLLNVMNKFGFGEKFIKWIRACISEPWIAPLVNGRATDFFKASRGLRQGCPLSPLLFVIQASVLSFLLNKSMQDHEINGLCITRGAKNINHELFADDTLLLGPATLPSASKFKGVLDELSKATGCVVNKSKCHIYSWNITPRALSDISRCLGFAASSSWASFNYLGLPVHLKKLSSKILWKITAPNPGWAQIAIWKKYYTGPRTRCLENAIQMPNSSFLKLNAKVAHLITDHAFWIPGSGKKIKIWSDRIMNQQPIETRANLNEMRRWMDNNSLHTLWDISKWHDGFWAGWIHFNGPTQLGKEWDMLLDCLHGIAPISRRSRDRKGWGTSLKGYTVDQGYIKLSEIPYAPPDPTPWRGVWSSPSLPKIDFFAWQLCHSKILTYDILHTKNN
eukprot:PITA_27221